MRSTGEEPPKCPTLSAWLALYGCGQLGVWETKLRPSSTLPPAAIALMIVPTPSTVTSAPISMSAYSNANMADMRADTDTVPDASVTPE